tara:strand:- start:799 stop:906 length:108 start_codon:yes stop_codon:yes gene_type:complete
LNEKESYIDLLKDMDEEKGAPYQSLLNLSLRDATA